MLTDVKYFNFWNDHKTENFNAYIWICKSEISVLILLLPRTYGFLDFKSTRNRCNHAIMPPDLPNSSNTVSPEAQNYPLTHSYLVSSKEQTRLGTVEHLVLLRPKETLLTFKVKQFQNHSQVMLLAVKTWCHFFCWIQLMTRKTEWVQSCEAIKEVQIAASHVLLKHLQVKNPLLLYKMSFSTEWLPFSSCLIVVLGHRLKVWLGYLFTARK